MKIISYTFILFTAASALLYYRVPRRAQNAVLLAVSWVFYMWAAPRQAAALLLCCVSTYLFALAADRSDGKKRRKAFTAAGIIVNLALLLFFKYSGFISGILNSIGGVGASRAASLAVPLGISFFTLQLIGYAVDVMRGDFKAEKNIVDFLLFASFFPAILSGPIGRAGELLPQYKQPRTANYDELRSGMLRFLTGVFKKAVVADGIARFNDVAYSNVTAQNTLTLLLVIALYSLQIYFDFSGYTDMALGTASIFGIRLRENFFAPYAAVSLTEFWSRWHVSFSSWLRDYVYIPLGGNRKGFVRKLLNLLIVFLVSGLWHGAGYTFILWGLWHGVFRAVEEIGVRLLKTKERLSSSRALLVGGKVWTNAVVAFGWVLFRIDDISLIPLFLDSLVTPEPLSQTTQFFRSVMLTIGNGALWYSQLTLALLALSVVGAILLDLYAIRRSSEERRCYNPLAEMSPRLLGAAVALMTLMIIVIGVFDSSGFIYYNF